MAILEAARWIIGTLTGTLAAGLGMISVAMLGIAMLAGRVDTRRAVAIVVGLFMVFAAPHLVQSILLTSPSAAAGAAPTITTPTPQPICWTC